jgi:hypothetical protein
VAAPAALHDFTPYASSECRCAQNATGVRPGRGSTHGREGTKHGTANVQSDRSSLLVVLDMDDQWRRAEFGELDGEDVSLVVHWLQRYSAPQTPDRSRGSQQQLLSLLHDLESTAEGQRPQVCQQTRVGLVPPDQVCPTFRLEPPRTGLGIDT